MRLTVNFLLKKARQKQNGEIPIYVRFTMNGKRVELATGVSSTIDKLWCTHKYVPLLRTIHARIMMKVLDNEPNTVSVSILPDKRLEKKTNYQPLLTSEWFRPLKSWQSVAVRKSVFIDFLTMKG